jgi:hypothetical protein
MHFRQARGSAQLADASIVIPLPFSSPSVAQLKGDSRESGRFWEQSDMEAFWLTQKQLTAV